MKKIIITQTDINEKQVLFTGLFENDRLVEVHLENAVSERQNRTALGNIYVGKVQNVAKNIGAVFVDIAPGLSCYYPYGDKSEPVFVRKMPSPQLAQNDEILVQVQKDAVKSKAPTVSSNLNLTGRYVVITSENKHIGVSSKLDSIQKAELKKLIEEKYEGEYGVVVRTNAKNASAEDILTEIEFLTAQMNDMIEHAGTRACYSCIHQSLPKYLHFLQSIYASDLQEIITDQPEIYLELQRYCGRYSDLKEVPLRLYEDSYPLSALYNIKKQMERALQNKVWLPSGGFLVIEPTEALTVIDVNTGKSVSGKHPQTHYFEINIEAAKEIAYQMRLRNLSGIIIIDFIDMKSKDDQTKLTDRLKSYVKYDPVPVQVHDITKLNLVELTRKKVEKSLLEQLK